MVVHLLLVPLWDMEGHRQAHQCMIEGHQWVIMIGEVDMAIEIVEEVIGDHLRPATVTEIVEDIGGTVEDLLQAIMIVVVEDMAIVEARHQRWHGNVVAVVEGGMEMVIERGGDHAVVVHLIEGEVDID